MPDLSPSAQSGPVEAILRKNRANTRNVRTPSPALARRAQEGKKKMSAH